MFPKTRTHFLRFCHKNTNFSKFFRVQSTARDFFHEKMDLCLGVSCKEQTQFWQIIPVCLNMQIISPPSPMGGLAEGRKHSFQADHMFSGQINIVLCVSMYFEGEKRPNKKMNSRLDLTHWLPILRIPIVGYDFRTGFFKWQRLCHVAL